MLAASVGRLHRALRATVLLGKPTSAQRITPCAVISVKVSARAIHNTAVASFRSSSSIMRFIGKSTQCQRLIFQSSSLDCGSQTSYTYRFRRQFARWHVSRPIHGKSLPQSRCEQSARKGLGSRYRQQDDTIHVSSCVYRYGVYLAIVMS